MTLNTDEQTQAQEEKRHARGERLFRSRWPLTTVFVLMLAMHLYSVLLTGRLWLGRFPYFNFVAFFHHREAFLQSLITLGFAGMPAKLWIEVAKYRREEEKRAQEALWLMRGVKGKAFGRPHRKNRSKRLTRERKRPQSTTQRKKLTAKMTPLERHRWQISSNTFSFSRQFWKMPPLLREFSGRPRPAKGKQQEATSKTQARRVKQRP